MAEARLRATGQLAMHGLLPVDATRLNANGEEKLLLQHSFKPAIK